MGAFFSKAAATLLSFVRSQAVISAFSVENPHQNYIQNRADDETRYRLAENKRRPGLHAEYLRKPKWRFRPYRHRHTDDPGDDRRDVETSGESVNSARIQQFVAVDDGAFDNQ